jgi:glycosyltransferase involved in cell wall biosynthesis
LKLLWVKTDFLHPTTRGGQIRTLEIVKRLHQRNEVHYIAYDDPSQPEGVQRAGEYSARAYPVAHHAPSKRSLGFVIQLAGGLVSPLPVAVSRWKSDAMRAQIAELSAREKFDAIVCDFLAPAPSCPALDRCVLFQHNVETMIWRRHVEHAPDPLRRLYLKLQADRMEAYEREVCRKVRRVIAVSEADAKLMREMFGIGDVPIAATGVDTGYFDPRQHTESAQAKPAYDLIFVGSMDWLPNTDGMKFFTASILPLIRRAVPQCKVAIVGRTPSPEIQAMAAADPLITVTGTVPDVRPYLWTSRVSIVPLRIGGGTRLKIYESMAAACPVVSTTIGAEGLSVSHPRNIRLADTPEQFASECIRLLQAEDERAGLAEAACRLVREHFSWDIMAREFEAILTA